MKYSESNPPLKMPMTQSTWYRNTVRQKPVGIVWHSFGSNDNENAYLKRFCQPDDNAINKNPWLNRLGINEKGDDWNHRNNEAGFNCWIGRLKDGSVTSLQVSPWNFRAWGRGGNSRYYPCNTGWIQICICEDDLNNPVYFEKAYREACELTAYLCKKFKIDPNGLSTNDSSVLPNITCDADAYTFGACTEFGSLKDWLSKNGKSMATVRNDVIQLIETVVDESVTSSDNISVAQRDNNSINHPVNDTGNNIDENNTEGNTTSLEEKTVDQNNESDDDDGIVDDNSNIDTETSDTSNLSYSPYIPVTEAEWIPPRCQEPADEVASYTKNNITELCEDLGVPEQFVSEGDYKLESSGTGVRIRAVKKSAEKKISSKPTVKKAVKKSPIRESTNVVVPKTDNTPTKKNMYSVRKSANDMVTEKGTYELLSTAVHIADTFADDGYSVYDSNSELVYTPTKHTNSYEFGKLYGQQIIRITHPEGIESVIDINNDNVVPYDKKVDYSTENITEKLSLSDRIYNFIISIINKIFKK